MSTISVETLIEAGVHYGHTTRKWHPAMKEYIHSSREGIHIIDARISLEKLKEVYNFVTGLASKGGKVLFVGTKIQARDSMKSEATRCGCYYVINRWLGGTLTNFSTIRQSITKLNKLDQLAGEDNTYQGVIKKEAFKYEKLRQKMLSNLAGIRTMRKAPAALFVVDIRYEDIVVKEAKTLGIPVIAIVDSNANPNHVDFPIPGNDDSIKSIDLFASVVASAVNTGREIFERKAVADSEQEQPEETADGKAEGEKADSNVSKPESVAVETASAAAPEAKTENVAVEAAPVAEAEAKPEDAVAEAGEVASQPESESKESSPEKEPASEQA